MTPNTLADELGISPTTLREWLRKVFTRPEELKGTHWYLTPTQIRAARSRFA
jgi:predicted site-specific integrase-resolvase